METSCLTKKHKRGDIRDDGMVFWQYNRNAKTPEIWVSKERFVIIHKRDCERQKQYNQKNKEKRRGYELLRRQKNKEKNNANTKKWRERNPERCTHLQREWRKNNRDRFRNTRRIYMANKRKTDPLFKLRCNISTLIQNGIRNAGYSKKTKTSEILGCDYESFKSHIEQRFKEGMTWENREEWHLDHIIPISFGKTEEQIIKLNHYTNFQPLWGAENRKKSNKLPEQLPV